MRACLTLIIVCIATATAAADSDLVLGPVGSGASPAQIKKVREALAAASIGKLGDKQIDIVCAGDPNCLAAKGSEAGARRVAGVSVAPGAKGALKINITLVDVEARLLLGQRELSSTDKRLAASIKKFAEEAPTDKAKALFEVANNHYSLGEFDQALAQYQTAYRIKPLPAFLFNIAQCDRKLGKHKDAVLMYQSYLAAFPDAQNKALVESLIKESQDKLALEQKSQADKAAAATQLEKDRLAAEQKKAVEARKAKEAEAAAEAERAKAEQVRIAREKELYDRHPARKFMIVTGTLGVGAMVAGGYFGVQARNAQRSFDDAGCGDPSVLLGADALATCRTNRDTGKRDALLSNAFLIGGGAAVLGSLLVFVIDPGNVERPETPRASVGISPSSVQVVIRW